MQMALYGGPDFFNPCERPLPLHLKVLLLGDPTIWAHQSIPWRHGFLHRFPILRHQHGAGARDIGTYRDQDGITTNEDAHIGKPSRMSFNLFCLLDFTSNLGSVWSSDLFQIVWIATLGVDDCHKWLLPRIHTYCPSKACFVQDMSIGCSNMFKQLQLHGLTSWVGVKSLLPAEGFSDETVKLVISPWNAPFFLHLSRL